MKKTLIILCSAVVLVGCDQNRGGTGTDTDRDTGFRSSRETTYPSSRSTDSGSLTNTNNATATPGANSRPAAPVANESSGTAPAPTTQPQQR